MGSCTSAAPKPCSAFPTGSNPSPAIAASTPSLAQHLPACRSSPPPADGAELRPVVVFRSRPRSPRRQLCLLHGKIDAVCGGAGRGETASGARHLRRLDLVCLGL